MYVRLMEWLTVDVMGYASDRWINIFEKEVYQFDQVSLPSKSDEEASKKTNIDYLHTINLVDL
jgi:hypothetical protein